MKQQRFRSAELRGWGVGVIQDTTTLPITVGIPEENEPRPRVHSQSQYTIYTDS